MQLRRCPPVNQHSRVRPTRLQLLQFPTSILLLVYPTFKLSASPLLRLLLRLVSPPHRLHLRLNELFKDLHHCLQLSLYSNKHLHGRGRLESRIRIQIPRLLLPSSPLSSPQQNDFDSPSPALTSQLASQSPLDQLLSRCNLPQNDPNLTEVQPSHTLPLPVSPLLPLRFLPSLLASQRARRDPKVTSLVRRTLGFFIVQRESRS